MDYILQGAQSLIFYLKFGLGFFYFSATAIFFYIAWIVLSNFFVGVFLKNNDARYKAIVLIKKSITLLCILVVASVVLGVSLYWFNKVPRPERIMEVDDALMRIDKNLFGTYVPFWFQNINNPFKPMFDVLSPIILIGYLSLADVLSILFFVVLIMSHRKFYEVFLAFALCFVISMPLWYFFPALAPFDDYYDNIFQREHSLEIQEAMTEYEPNPSLQAFFEDMRERRNNFTQGSFAITTMPSMHIAWATLAVYIGAYVWTPLLILLIPYAIINVIAIAFSLQHYFVDALVGGMVAIIAIMIARSCIAYVNRRGIVNDDLSIILQRDIQSYIQGAKDFIADFRSRGSIVASSTTLARTMASAVSYNMRQIVEFGAGSGVITQEILNRLHPDGRLIVFEIDEHCVKQLRSIEDKRMTVVHASYEEVFEKLRLFNMQSIDCVISSIPMSLLSSHKRETFLHLSREILIHGGLFIQYQYILPFMRKKLRALFNKVTIRFVLKNIPPAFIYSAEKV